MSSNASLTCNFTITTSLDVGIVSDDEDFLAKSYIFSLTPGGETYQLSIVEKLSQERS
jgi:hypothetical protein